MDENANINIIIAHDTARWSVKYSDFEDQANRSMMAVLRKHDDSQIEDGVYFVASGGLEVVGKVLMSDYSYHGIYLPSGARYCYIYADDWAHRHRELYCVHTEPFFLLIYNSKNGEEYYGGHWYFDIIKAYSVKYQGQTYYFVHHDCDSEDSWSATGGVYGDYMIMVNYTYLPEPEHYPDTYSDDELKQIALDILLGSAGHCGGGQHEINAVWKRPSDNQELSATFNIGT